MMMLWIIMSAIMMLFLSTIMMLFMLRIMVLFMLILLDASQSTLGNLLRRCQDCVDDNATDIRSLIHDKNCTLCPVTRCSILHSS